MLLCAFESCCIKYAKTIGVEAPVAKPLNFKFRFAQRWNFKRITVKICHFKNLGKKTALMSPQSTQPFSLSLLCFSSSSRSRLFSWMKRKISLPVSRAHCLEVITWKRDTLYTFIYQDLIHNKHLLKMSKNLISPYVSLWVVVFISLIASVHPSTVSRRPVSQTVAMRTRPVLLRLRSVRTCDLL